MNHYVYSDPHFNHARIIEYAERPFEDVQEMNIYMIDIYNNVVKEEDKVYILGDMGFGDKEIMSSILSAMKGYKILIMGNHDRLRNREWWLDAGFDEVSKDPILIRKQFILSHEPIAMSSDMPYYNIHGHIHNNAPVSRKHFNASVENTKYMPVNISKLVRLIKKQNSQMKKEDL